MSNCIDPLARESRWKTDVLTRKEIRGELVAETHRERADAEILTLASSFESDEPLRQSFLAAAPVRRVLDGAVKRPRHPELGPTAM